MPFTHDQLDDGVDGGGGVALTIGANFWAPCLWALLLIGALLRQFVDASIGWTNYKLHPFFLQVSAPSWTR